MGWKKLITDKIHEREKKEWKWKLDRKPRLKTYAAIKTRLNMESYLDAVGGTEKRLIVEFRSGVNHLEDEMGEGERSQRN